MNTVRASAMDPPSRIGPWSEVFAALGGYGAAMVFWRWALIASDAPAAAVVMAAVVLLRPVSGWWVWCLAGVLGLPLAVRRRWPVVAFVAVLLGTVASLVVGVGTEVAVYAVAFALYPVAVASARAAAWGLAGALGGVLVPGAVDALTTGLPFVAPRGTVESFTTAPLTVAVYSVVVITATWTLAWSIRIRRRHTTQLAELHTARAVAEERLRIARDVHDVVGHNLSLIAMKAAVANHLRDEQTLALRMIEQVSRATLNEVRTVLDDVRADCQPTVGLDELVEQTRAAGVDVTLEQMDLSAVPVSVRMSVHQILREALTNVRRHADATHCRVTVTVAPDAVTLAVMDDGAAPNTLNPSGHGLLGMRERVAMHGGSLTAGPELAGGFAVHATLPLPA